MNEQEDDAMEGTSGMYNGRRWNNPMGTNTDLFTPYNRNKPEIDTPKLEQSNKNSLNLN